MSFIGIPTSTIAKVGSVCFFEWATIHVVVGVLMCPLAVRNEVAKYYLDFLVELAPKDDRDAIEKAQYPKWIGRALFQHGYNLIWLGGFSYLCSYELTKETVSDMLPVLSLVPWLADVGYFMAIDLPELGGVPAQCQTYIVTLAAICGAIVTAEQHGTDSNTLTMQILGFSTLALAALVNKITWKMGWRKHNPKSVF